MRARLALPALVATVLALAGGADAAAARTPVVFFPGYGTTVLKVTVHDQATVKGCPASGRFEDGVPADVGTAFSPVCRDRLLTPRWRHDRRLSWPRRFSLPPGVRVSIPAYGDPSSAPIYQGFYGPLEAAGYRAGRDLVVAGYDFRLTPDLGGFLPRTKRLIVRTWRHNGHRRVRLVGHSNGPLYAQYLLTHVSERFKRRYVQGFTNIAGNLPGQGGVWTWIFTGIDVSAGFAFPATPATARSSARLAARSPATWMSAPDPAVFGRREVVVRSHGRSYTPADTAKLLRAAGLRSLTPMAEHYLGLVRFRGRAHFPDVDVTAEKGSGLPTQVGVVLPDLRRGQVLDPATADFIDRPGDGNQEFITNDAVRVWRHMRCHRFRLIDNPGVDHLGLTTDPHVLARLLRDLRRPRARCG